MITKMVVMAAGELAMTTKRALRVGGPPGTLRLAMPTETNPG